MALAAVVVPQLVVLAIVPEARNATVLAGSTALVVSTVALASGFFLYLHHRLTACGSTAWLSTGLVVVGTVGLTTTGIELTPPYADPVLPLLVDLLVVVALLATARAAERARPLADPAGAGLAIGLVLSGVGVALTLTDTGSDLSLRAGPVVAAPLVLVAGLVGLEVRRLTTLPRWARNQLAIALVVVVTGRAVWIAAGPDSTAAPVASAVASTVAAVLLFGTTLALLRLAINDDRVAITALQDQLAATAEHARVDRERLHEVKGTIAGIASASRLIHGATPLPGLRREMLEEMLEKESARLQRLVHGGVPGPIGVLQVDDVIRPLVVGRQAQGLNVTWRPSGVEVWAREDDLTEVLNILLDNATRHAPGKAVAVLVRRVGGEVRIIVADSGPGIPAELRTTVFERGVRSPESTGEGLGLHVGRRLVQRFDGSLDIDDTWEQGAAFVVRCRRVSHLPEGRRDDDAAEFVAQ